MNNNIKSNLITMSIIGLIIILSLMVLYSKLKKPASIIAPSASSVVTVNNEFNQPLSSAVTNDQTASANFVFQVTAPIDASISKTATISVIGKTVPDADIYVNDIDGKADLNGNFNIKYTLNEGDNYLVVGGNDSDGNYKEVNLTVTYTP